MNSWKTTCMGICALLTIIGSAGTALLDGDPLTNPDWITLVPGIMAAIGLIMARDNSKTSEDVGAK